MEATPETQDPSRVSPEQLRDAIEGRQLQLYYQPVVSLDDLSATLLEALPRWPRRDGRVLGPADFIGVAERNGLLGGLEIWGISAAFEQLSRWRTGVSGDLCVSLNLSEEHVHAGDVAQAVSSASSSTDVRPERVQFEISERALIQADGRSLAKLRALSGIGVSLVIDDYTGAAPFDRLAELPVGALKIGRSVVAGIPDDPGKLEIAVQAVRVGRELGLTVIANGVENPGQLSSLRDMGCDRAQGFYFSVPMPAEVLEERMLPR